MFPQRIKWNVENFASLLCDWSANPLLNIVNINLNDSFVRQNSTIDANHKLTAGKHRIPIDLWTVANLPNGKWDGYWTWVKQIYINWIGISSSQHAVRFAIFDIRHIHTKYMINANVQYIRKWENWLSNARTRTNKRTNK